MLLSSGRRQVVRMARRNVPTHSTVRQFATTRCLYYRVPEQVKSQEVQTFER